MSKKISIPVFLAVCAIAVVLTFQITFLGVSMSYREKIAEENAGNTKENWQSKLEYIDQLTKEYFLNEIPEEELEDILPAAYVAALGDKYTCYMTKEEYDSFNSDMNADMQGIGINVVYNRDYDAIEVISVVNGSPAMESGVMSGDIIDTVEGYSVSEIGYTEAVNMMLGKAGTQAVFSVIRKNADNLERVDFKIERGFIIEQTVSGKMFGENVGIIRIEEFDNETPKQFKDTINGLIEQGADRFVFDVRYNPGGSLDSIVEILDMLLPKGPIIRITDRYGEESVIESDESSMDYMYAVIINGDSASAAELFTAALRDYKKAVIVGETSYGKGTMQSIIPLSDGSAVRMTTQTFCPPFSESYDGIGIIPDIEVSIDEKYANVNILKLDFEQDIQLKTAVEQLAAVNDNNSNNNSNNNDNNN